MELVSIQLCQDAGQWKGRKREKQRFMGLREDIFLRWQSWERLGFEGGVECGVKWKMFSYVWLFESPWIVVQGILQANTGVGSLSLLQGIFPTQGSNPGLQHCRQILYHLTHQGQGINKTASYSNRKSSGSLVNSQLLTAGLSHIKITGDIAFLERGYCYWKEDSPLN